MMAANKPTAAIPPTLAMKRPASLLEEVLAGAAAEAEDATVRAVLVAVRRLLGTVMLLVGVRTGMETLPVPLAPVTAAVEAATNVVMDMVEVRLAEPGLVPLPAGFEAAPPLGFEMPNWVEYW